MQIYRQFSCKTFTDVVGQDKIIKLIQRRMETTGLAGCAYLLTGPSGTGKTSIGNLIAAEVADEWNTQELDAKGLTGAGILEMERSLSTYGLGEKNGRAVIINEVHGLRKDAIHQLLTTLERIPSHVAWIFTTTNDGMSTIWEDCPDAGPFLSRCLPLALANQGLCKPFAQRAFDIAIQLGLTDKPLKAFEALAKDCRNNLRMMLSRIESGAMLS